MQSFCANCTTDGVTLTMASVPEKQGRPYWLCLRCAASEGARIAGRKRMGVRRMPTEPHRRPLTLDDLERR